MGGRVQGSPATAECHWPDPSARAASASCAARRSTRARSQWGRHSPFAQAPWNITGTPRDVPRNHRRAAWLPPAQRRYRGCWTRARPSRGDACRQYAARAGCARGTARLECGVVRLEVGVIDIDGQRHRVGIEHEKRPQAHDESRQREEAVGHGGELPNHEPQQSETAPRDGAHAREQCVCECGTPRIEFEAVHLESVRRWSGRRRES
jgi:hypothetical protein